MVTLSADEIVAVTKHTNLPTVFVEGPDDMFVLNRIEQILGSLRANFLPCGSKDTLLTVFDRRGEFTNVPYCFLADKDMWVFSNVPEKFREVVFSEGYSIENDLYSDSNIERILDADEKKQHAALIKQVCRWFCCEVDKYQKGADFRSDPNLSRLIPLPGITCCPVYLKEIGFYEPPAELVSAMIKNYSLNLRGKLLYEIVVRLTHDPKRKARKYSYSALKELSIVYGLEGKLMTRIVNDIRSKLGIASPDPELPLAV